MPSHKTTRFNWMFTDVRPDPREGQMRDINDFARIRTKIKLHKQIREQTTTVEAIIRESPYQDANETWWLPIITISWVGDIP
ncbi:hypothetical protein C4564_03595, partial [Candidatus Microgenomates bacterium]